MALGHDGHEAQADGIDTGAPGSSFLVGAGAVAVGLQAAVPQSMPADTGRVRPPASLQLRHDLP